MRRHSKSRSGCSFCKLKRLKCDETIPACRNCLLRGLVCPGYRQSLKWSTKYEISSGPALSSGPADPPGFSQLASAASQSIQKKEAPIDSPPSPSSPPLKIACADEPVRSPSSISIASSSGLLQAGTVLGLHAHHPLATSPDGTSSWGSDTPYLPIGAVDPTTGGSWSPCYPDSPYSIIPPPTEGDEECPDLALCTYDEPLSLDPIFEETKATKKRSPAQRRRLSSGTLTPAATGRRLHRLPSPGPGRVLSLPSTTLVEFWFKSVCGMWAARDSPSNPFRRLCLSLWRSSGPVFYSLQSMAAVSLPPVMAAAGGGGGREAAAAGDRYPPGLQEAAALAPQMSTRALIQELEALFQAPHAVCALPAGLLVSLFCMSSSLSWADPRQLGAQYLRNARSVLNLLDMRASFLSQEDRELLEFFRGCLIYEEMLRSIVSDDEEDFRALLEWRPPAPPLPPPPSGDVSRGNDPEMLALHSWTGVPTVVVGLFGKVTALCRRSRRLWRHSAAPTYALMYQAIRDIQEGKELEERLLTMDPLACSPSGTATTGNKKEDEARTHLYSAAEAFRLSSLLQLYQTFPDLISQRLSSQAAAADGSVPHGRWLLPLVLRIIDVLAGMPVSSGTRCLQPLLCICAGSALRQDSSPHPEVDLDGLLLQHAGGHYVGEGGSSPPLLVITGGETSRGPGGGCLVVDDVRRARDFLRDRLAQLGQILPPKPIAVARQLLEEIWATLDSEVPPQRSHWLDVIARNKFESVFWS